MGYDFTLHNVRWTKDLAVSGTATWGASAKISAQVTLVQGGQNIGSLTMSWSDGDIEAVATVTGTINSHRVHGTRIAP
ncbi:MAG: hypothetical protein JSS29_03385 [Proteobacteria bacterium]|nr:hypothetical protein [Pseudomonadota bacterium]